MALDRIFDILCCPRCRAALQTAEGWRCTDPTCDYHVTGFPEADGKPILIDFADSIFDRDSLVATKGASPVSRAQPLARRIREYLANGNNSAPVNCETFVAEVRRNPNPRVLIIGGGARGRGTEPLYAANDILRVGVDVYASADVDLLADGHRLPFADGSFDGVWIQAVLEHVVTPAKVVAEIHRTLAQGGIVYVETPFLQPVHERAYDFTRFTRSGHRWLLQQFAEVRSGATGGPAESLLWSIRYFGRSLFRSDKIGSLFAVAFFWIRYFDLFVDEQHRSDAATGVFFMGRKTGETLKPRDLVDYFPGVRGI